ncbi:TPA: hypothetical protein SL854_003178 [Pseudomonas aeruginosa]|uniref:hypothetical protein n=1 Tax=Pseudomonas aeruginosa TaxID=287 RepID=UPI0029D9B042|nr:hypothetical protein [Pseudomonas aeruginosa]HEJ6473647.1 hypothetical protein [Pseudomonas aeruginosa]
MTDINKLKELAELASKATPGPWWIDSHGHCMVSESQDHRTVFLTNDGMGPATRHPETGNLSHWPNDWDASYIASADPTTILALIAEVENLRRFAAEAYQVLGALEAPENVLDNASDAAHGIPLRHETLLPFFAEEYEELRKDAERWRYARTILPYEVIQDAQKDLESWNVGVSEAENKRCDEAIDAALEGATQ